MRKELKNRPLATFALFAYNQERYIREAVEGAFAQTYEPMEIILSDDCSKDRTLEIMKELADEYTGHHKIRVNQNSKNIGVGAHFSKLADMAASEVIVVAAGDDVSEPSRVATCMDVLLRENRISFIETGCTRVDISGLELREGGKMHPRTQEVSLQSFLAGEVGFLTGASRAYRKSVMDTFGPISDGCPTEDSVMLLRSLLINDGLYLSERLVRKRLHETNLSSIDSLEKMDIDAIGNQYERDLGHARALDFVDERLNRKIVSWIEKTRLRRKMCQSGRLNLTDLARAITEHMTNHKLGIADKARVAKYAAQCFLRGWL